MKKKKIFLFSAVPILTTIVATPFFFINNHSLNSQTSTPNPILFNLNSSKSITPTNINQNIEASALGLNDSSVDVALKMINKEFVFNHKQIFFSGTISQITSPSQIKIVNLSKADNSTISLVVGLIASAWYDENGNLGSTDKTFPDIKIVNLKVLPIPTPPRPPIIIPNKTTLLIKSISNKNKFNEIFGPGKFFVEDWVSKTSSMSQKLQTHIKTNLTTYFSNIPDKTNFPLSISFIKTDGNRMSFELSYYGFNGMVGYPVSQKETLDIFFKQAPTLLEISDMVKEYLKTAQEKISVDNATILVAEAFNTISDDLPNAFLPKQNETIVPFDASMFSFNTKEQDIFVSLKPGIVPPLNELSIILKLPEQHLPSVNSNEQEEFDNTLVIVISVLGGLTIGFLILSSVSYLFHKKTKEDHNFIGE